MKIKVWICPTDGCGNYYASSSQAHINLTLAEVLQADVTHTVKTDPSRPAVRRHRGDCPDCGTARVPCEIEIDLADLVSAGAPIQEARVSQIA